MSESNLGSRYWRPRPCCTAVTCQPCQRALASVSANSRRPSSLRCLSSQAARPVQATGLVQAVRLVRTLFLLRRVLVLIKALFLSLTHEPGDGVQWDRCDGIGPASCCGPWPVLVAGQVVAAEVRRASAMPISVGASPEMAGEGNPAAPPLRRPCPRGLTTSMWQPPGHRSTALSRVA